jgi:hypothetical protein
MVYVGMTKEKKMAVLAYWIDGNYPGIVYVGGVDHRLGAELNGCAVTPISREKAKILLLLDHDVKKAPDLWRREAIEEMASVLAMEAEERDCPRCPVGGQCDRCPW